MAMPPLSHEGNILIGWYAKSFDPSKASIRLRLLQPMEYLRGRGVKTDLFDPEKGVEAYEAIIFSKSLQSATLLLARAAKAAGKRVIFDICDNIFEAKDSPAKARKIERLREILLLADVVVYATPALQEQISGRVPLMSAQQLVIPDMLEDLSTLSGRLSLKERFEMMRLRRFQRIYTGAMHCVWFGKCQGSRSGLVHVHAAVRELELFSRSHKVTLTIIGDQRLRYWSASRQWDIPHFYLPWTLGSFWPAMKMHNVAIVPVAKNDYTVGKTINRPATALRAGLGVIADTIPAYEELRPFIVLDDWQQGLHRYRATHPSDDAGCEAARKHIETLYGEDAVGSQWMALAGSVSEKIRPSVSQAPQG